MTLVKTSLGKIRVDPIGPKDSPVVMIGEAPAKTEVYAGEPFKGSAGQHLDRLLNLTGLDREKIYITNISKYRAPADKIANLSSDELAQCESELIEEINNLPNVKIIVPLGAYALAAVTKHRGISNFRGSVLSPIEAIKHDCIVIPTYHPSALHWHYELWAQIAADFTKIKRIWDNNFEYEKPVENFILGPSFEKTIQTLKWLRENPPKFAVIDVETPHNLLSCVGLAWSRRDAICIPFFWGNGQSYWSLEHEIQIWKELQKTLLALKLAGQNVLFDWRIMTEHGFTMPDPYHDSMLMHHCLYSELPHKLDMIVSIYTNIPFYKKDEEEKKGSALRAGHEQEHWIYNARDCIGTFWAIEELEIELVDEKMLDFYKSFYVELLPIIFKMNMEGIPVDVERLEKVRGELKELVSQYEQKITEETGYEVNANSPKQVAELLYEKMNMVRYKGASTNKETLEKLAYKYKTDIPSMIIDIRAARKELGLFSEENVVDGCVKCEYSLGRTTTGRFASRKGRGRGGMNLQNVKKGEQRRFFIPPPGYIMISADQQNAEARIVAWLADDEAMTTLFAAGESLHLKNAENVFGERITKSDPRYRIAKALIHGGNYGMGPRKFALITGLPFAEAKMHLEGYHATYPGIRSNFHAYVIEEIKSTRTLYNPFGRRQIFLGRMQTNTFQAGFAFIPQSTVSDINKSALKRIAKYYRVLLETHDSLTIAVPEKEAEYGIEAIIEAYDIHFKIWGRDHTVPVDVSVGPNWGDQVEIDLKGV